MKNIVLIGFKKSGKTTLAKLLAKRLSQPWIDTDDRIESLYEQKHLEKKSCREIYHKQGEAYFRSLEREAILELFEEEKVIIATGGGTLLLEENGTHLKRLGFLVFLDVSREMLRKRTQEEVSFLHQKTPSEWDFLFEERRKLYLRWADSQIVTEGKSQAELIEEIIQSVYGQQ